MRFWNLMMSLSMDNVIHKLLNQEPYPFEDYIAITKEIEEAQRYSLFTCIISAPGNGKTVCSEHYIQKYPNAYKLTLNPTLRRKEFFAELLGAVTDDFHDTSMMDERSIKRALLFQLRSITGKKVIIIDEAGRFNVQLTQIYQYLRDQNRVDTGLVLLGPPRFLKNLLGWNRSDETGMPELISRVNKFVLPAKYKNDTRIPFNRIFLKLKGATQEDMIHMCMHNNIKDPKLYNKIIKKCRTFRDVEAEIIEHLIKLENTKK